MRKKNSILLLFLVTAVFLNTGGQLSCDDSFKEDRELMVKHQIEVRGIKNPQVLEAMAAVPRHEFVPPVWQSLSYDDGPLPIGYGQTISQPYIVALMTELAEIKPGDRVLEVGTGSGYQAAVCSEITDHVYTIEIIKELAAQAEERLKRLGYDKVSVKFGDGYFGWKEQAPFEAIIVTAAADHIPPPLIEQLKHGGSIVIPLGSPFQQQWLVVVKKNDKGKITSRNIIPVAFVPFTRSDKS